jgi:hypothetical protein
VKTHSSLSLRRFGASALLAAVLTVASFMSGHPLLTNSASAGPAPKIQICHVPPGNPANWHTITISEKALKAHLKHGDLPGACGEHCETLCDDANACTVDACDGSESCVYEPVDCTDGNICTADACNPATGCEYVALEGDVCPVDDDLPCTQDTGQCLADDLTIALCEPDMVPGCCMIDDECADEDLCTIRTCELDNRCAHTGDITCSTDACHVSACNPTTGDCSVPEEILCEELECHATACDPGSGCVTVPIEGCCVSNEECDDGNNCTTDVCHGVNGCSNDPCAAGDECNVLVGCEADCTAITEWMLCEDDGNLCTVESCQPGQGCVSEEVPCAEGDVCNPETGACITEDVTGGLEYILVFQENYQSAVWLYLFISGDLPATGVVEVANLGFSQPFSVTPGTVTEVLLPTGAELNTVDVVEVDAAIRVAASSPVHVNALNQRTGTTDAFATLPVQSLGQEHMVLAWPGHATSQDHRSELAIAATQDGTNVTITPTADVGTRLAGVPYTITLDRLDAYQLMAAGGDLTGTLIESDAPIAVFGGNQCGQVPVNYGFCDHLAEQMPPLEMWGTQSLMVPLATRLGGDTVRTLAAYDNTTVLFWGPTGFQTAVLDAGEYIDLILTGNYNVTASNRILVAQYSNGTQWDGQEGDPSMTLLPPANRFLDSLSFSTPAYQFATNYVNIIAVSADALGGSVLLDGVPVPAGAFTAMPGSPYYGAQVAISVGSHTVQAPNPVGLYVYGFAPYMSYGYSGGFSSVP